VKNHQLSQTYDWLVLGNTTILLLLFFPSKDSHQLPGLRETNGEPVLRSKGFGVSGFLRTKFGWVVVSKIFIVTPIWGRCPI